MDIDIPQEDQLQFNFFEYLKFESIKIVAKLDPGLGRCRAWRGFQAGLRVPCLVRLTTALAKDSYPGERRIVDL
jgi:hypothetical protein